jgi:drug/metabolite transporter (DMT)-like permease
VDVARCLLTVTLLGGSFTVSRGLLAYPALSGQAMRYTMAAVALAALVALRRDRVWPTARELVRLAVVAATGLVAFNVLLLFSLRHASPAVVGTVVGGSPLVLALLGPLQEGRRPAPRLVVAAAVVVAGAAVVQGGGATDAAGLAGSIGLLLAESAFSLVAAPLLARLGPVRVSAWSCALAVPLLVVGAAVVGERPRVPTAGEAANLVFLGLVLTVVAFVAWYSGVRGLGVERAGVFVGLVPVTSLATMALVDGRLPAWTQVGGVLVVAAGLVAGLSAGTPRRTAAQPCAAPPRRRGLRPSPPQPG